MIIRLSKALLVFLVGLFSLLVGADNIIDYGTNYAFVEHVMAMDTLLPNTTLTWRSITSTTLNEIAYAFIIAGELMTGLLRVAGAFRLWQARGALAADYNAAKGVAVAGLVCGLALWFFGFLTVGGEWFQMWQSKTWNGQDPAFRMFTVIGIILLFVVQPETEAAVRDSR